MKLISWNVNGIRAVLKKNFLEFIDEQNPDIICLQEIKANKDQVTEQFPGYNQYWNSAKRKGYSGTLILTKIEPIAVQNYELGSENTDINLKDEFGDANTEGRVLTAEFDSFYVNTVYTPNSKRGLERLSFREKIWDPLYREYLQSLAKSKPVIACGDYNVAHTPDDLARPDGNEKNHGFTPEERQGFTDLLEAGFVDTFRMFTKGNGNYSWWSPFAKARERNVGWRIDYFLVSENISSKVKKSVILSDVMGSDHAPVLLEIDL